MTKESKIQNEQTKKDGLTVVLMRNEFYRDNYHRAQTALIIVVILNLLLGIGVFYKYFNPPEPQYFPTNPQYQLIKWHPLSDPIVDNSYILEWTANAVRQAFSLDFIHWRDQLQEASYKFTPSGWHWFLQALKNSGNLKTLVNLKMVSDAKITGSPVIQLQEVLDGRYIWEIELPILVSFTNPKRTINLPLKVTVIVQRVSVQTNPDRIAINQFLPVVQGSEVTT